MIVRYFAHSITHLSTYAIVLGLTITVGLVTVSIKEVLETERDVYNVQVDQITDVISRQMTVVEEVLHSMRVLFDASTFVDPDEFRILAEDSLSRHRVIMSAMYLPLLTDDERNSFVNARRDEGYQTFAITEFKDGRYKPAQRRDRYFPVIYQEPFDPATVGALGLDFMSLPLYAPFILQAIDSANSSTAMPEQKNSERKSYTVFKAVYAGKIDSEYTRDRRAVVNGLVALQVDAGHLFAGYIMDDRISVTLAMHSPIIANYVVPLLRKAGKKIDEAPRHLHLYSFDTENDIAVGSQHLRLKIHKELHWEDFSYLAVLSALSIGFFVTFLLWSLTKAVKARARDMEQRNQEIQHVVELRTLELAQEKERAQITLKSIGDAVISTDHEANVDYMNSIAEELTGWDAQAAKGKRVVDLYRTESETGDEEIQNLVGLCLETGETVKRQGTTVLINERGEEFAIDESAAPIFDPEGVITGVVLIVHDVSETRKLTQRMVYQATHDALTGLPNRVLLLDRLQQEFNRAPWSERIVAVMYLDLDRFKIVNDNLGHDAGDQLIRQVARRLKDCLRVGDTVARLGGDEFVILLSDVAHHDDVRLVANTVLDSFKVPFHIKRQEIFTSASIGISAYPEGGDNAKAMMKNADTAMYMAKDRGKNNFVFYSKDINLRGKNALSLETDLRRAIERKELFLHFQPQVDAVSEEVTGAEALVRWNHPRLGIMPPMKFIPLAEESDLIVDIGRWVLLEACRQNKVWQRMGMQKIRMAVNISDRQFHNNSLYDDVQHALITTELPAKYLELELTEGILAKDTDTAIRRLDQLKQTGIKLSIDDFGTGYSSLAQLKRFPLDTVKVDRAFVMDIVTNSSDAAICSAVIAMAHNLNLSVVAEGVETDQQLAFLRRKGCDFIQGYYYSPPVRGEDFMGVLERFSSKKYMVN